MLPEPIKAKKKVKVKVKRAKQQLVNWCMSAMPSGKSKNDYKLEINLKEKSGESIEITEFRELTDLEISSLSEDIVILEILPLDESESSEVDLEEDPHDNGDISAKSKKTTELDREEHEKLRKQYGGLLKKGVEKPVDLENSDSESESEEQVGLDDRDDDPSLKYWGIYTIDLTTEYLKKHVRSKQFSIDLQIPIEAMLPAILYEKFHQEANWFRQVTGTAEKKSLLLIDQIVARTKEADIMIQQCNGEPGKTATIIEQWSGEIESLAHRGAESIGEEVAEEVAALVEEYAKTKAAVRKYRKKRYVKCGVKTFSIAGKAVVGAATHVLAPSALVGIGKDLGIIGGEIMKLAQNPGTVAVQIKWGFDVLAACPEGKRGKNFVEFVANAANGATGGHFPLTVEALEKKIGDHLFAVQSLETAHHKIGKLLAEKESDWSLYAEEIKDVDPSKLNKFQRGFPMLIKKKEKLLELSVSYANRIKEHKQLNASFVLEFSMIQTGYSKYTKVSKAFDIIVNLALAMDPSELIGTLTDVSSELVGGAVEKAAK
jgi:hypothetical protein